MRNALLLLLVLSTVAFAKDKNWVEGKLSSIDSRQGESGTAVIPVGTMIMGVPIQRHTIFYTIDTADITYVVTPGVNKKPLNVTLRGNIKICQLGEKAYVLDDGGKQNRVYVSQKIARSPALQSGSSSNAQLPQ